MVDSLALVHEDHALGAHRHVKGLEGFQRHRPLPEQIRTHANKVRERRVSLPVKCKRHEGRRLSLPFPAHMLAAAVDCWCVHSILPHARACVPPPAEYTLRRVLAWNRSYIALLIGHGCDEAALQAYVLVPRVIGPVGSIKGGKVALRYDHEAGATT